MSSTSASRFSALRAAILVALRLVKLAVMSVAMKPGATAFTVTPSRPTSRARLRVKPIIDALVAP